MTRFLCPGCGVAVASTASPDRHHVCPSCGTAFVPHPGAHGFGILVHEDRLAVRLIVRGELDLVTAPVLARHLDGAIAGGRDVVEVDLADVTFMDLRGVNALIDARSALEADGRRLALHAPSDGVRRTLELCGVGDALVERSG